MTEEAPNEFEKMQKQVLALEEQKQKCLQEMLEYGRYLNSRWKKLLEGYEFTFSMNPSRFDFFYDAGIPREAHLLAEQCMKYAEKVDE